MSLALRPTSFRLLCSLLEERPNASRCFPVSLEPAPVSTRTLPFSVRIRRQLSPKLTRFHLSGFMCCSQSTFGI